MARAESLNRYRSNELWRRVKSGSPLGRKLLTRPGVNQRPLHEVQALLELGDSSFHIVQLVELRKSSLYFMQSLDHERLRCSLRSETAKVEGPERERAGQYRVRHGVPGLGSRPGRKPGGYDVAGAQDPGDRLPQPRFERHVGYDPGSSGDTATGPDLGGGGAEARLKRPHLLPIRPVNAGRDSAGHSA